MDYAIRPTTAVAAIRTGLILQRQEMGSETMPIAAVSLSRGEL